jgi:hypothetical protein
MAERIGEGALGRMAELGLEELRAANSGQETAPVEAPQAEAPQSFEAMVSQEAARVEPPQDVTLER